MRLFNDISLKSNWGQKWGHHNGFAFINKKIVIDMLTYVNVNKYQIINVH